MSIFSTSAKPMRRPPQSEAHPPANLFGEIDLLPDLAPGIEGAFLSEFKELDCALDCVDGQIPDFVRGTYYLNGPARFKVGDLSYRHWLDGDGMISKLHFDADGVHFTSRYIRSTKLINEQEAGKALYRGFGTSFSGSVLNRVNNGLESPVNVSVYPFGNRLLAFGEQGLPWELNPLTLETVGQYTFGGRFNDATPFAAHPKFDPVTGTMFNFGVFFSSHVARLYFYCFDQHGLRYRKSIPLPFSCSVHDFTISEHYAIFYLSPYLLDIKSVLHNGLTIMESLHWEPERGSILLILDRSNGTVVASIPVSSSYCLHLINSFELNNIVYVDLLEFAEPIYGQYQTLPRLFESISPGGPVRLLIDPRCGKIVERLAIDYLQAPDFPAVDPRHLMRSYDNFWMLGISTAAVSGRKFFDQLAHANWCRNKVDDLYQSPRGVYLGGEPVLISEPSTQNRIIICQEFNSLKAKSAFLLFDADCVRKGPIARLALTSPMYLGFHATFRPEPLGP